MVNLVRKLLRKNITEVFTNTIHIPLVREYSSQAFFKNILDAKVEQCFRNVVVSASNRKNAFPTNGRNCIFAV